MTKHKEQIKVHKELELILCETWELFSEPQEADAFLERLEQHISKALTTAEKSGEAKKGEAKRIAYQRGFKEGEQRGREEAVEEVKRIFVKSNTPGETKLILNSLKKPKNQ